MGIRHVKSSSHTDIVADSPDIDSWYAWLVCFTCFAVQTMVSGQAYSFSVILPVLINQFAQSKANTAWVGSMVAASLCGLSIVSAIVIGWYATCVFCALHTSVVVLTHSFLL